MFLSFSQGVGSLMVTRWETGGCVGQEGGRGAGKGWYYDLKEGALSSVPALTISICL
jgi:hypothetical protein